MKKTNILSLVLIFISISYSSAEKIILSSCENNKDGFIKNEYIPSKSRTLLASSQLEEQSLLKEKKSLKTVDYESIGLLNKIKDIENDVTCLTYINFKGLDMFAVPIEICLKANELEKTPPEKDIKIVFKDINNTIHRYYCCGVGWSPDWARCLYFSISSKIKL